MKIAVVGRGNVGGGLADLWEQAGHSVTRIGKDGGDVSETEAVLLAVPAGAIEAALDNVRGLDGKTVIDATNLFGADRPAGFQSNAEYVKSKTNGPTAKAFNLNLARLYGELGQAQPRCRLRAAPRRGARERTRARGLPAGLLRDLERDRTVRLQNGAAPESCNG